MSDATAASVSGTCRCGSVTIAAAGPPLITMACHCRECQRMTGSAFSLSSLYPTDHFQVTAGEPVPCKVGAQTTHYFCPQCHSWLYSQPVGMEQLVNIRATLLDDAAGFRPFMEVYTSEKLPWVNLPASHSFEKFPPMDAYPALLAAFAAG